MESIASFESIAILVPIAAFVVVAVIAALLRLDRRRIGEPVEIDLPALLGDRSDDGGD